MLGDKYRMIKPGCLLSIIGREGRRQSFLNEISSMLEDLTHPPFVKILELLLLQVDLAAECGLFQSG